MGKGPFCQNPNRLPSELKGMEPDDPADYRDDRLPYHAKGSHLARSIGNDPRPNGHGRHWCARERERKAGGPAR